MKIYNKNNLPVIDYKKLIPLQKDLKILSEQSKEKLKKSLLKYGFRFPFFVWKNNGKIYINDGHSRCKVLAELENEGENIPKLPYIEISAKDKKQAAELLLQLNSKYGEITESGFINFIESMDIKNIIDNIVIPEININNLIDLNDKKIDEKEIDILETKNKCPRCGYEW